MIGDIERLTLVQGQVIKLRRLAVETFESNVRLAVRFLCHVYNRMRDPSSDSYAPMHTSR
jgi:hypothetical protein